MDYGTSTIITCGRRFYSETNGKEPVDRTRQFAVVLNGDRSRDSIGGKGTCI